MALIIACVFVWAVYYSKGIVSTADRGMDQGPTQMLAQNNGKRVVDVANVKTAYNAENISSMTLDIPFSFSRKINAAPTAKRQRASAMMPTRSVATFANHPKPTEARMAICWRPAGAKDGSSQVTYNGWPLYRYVKDVGPPTDLGTT